MDEHVGAGGIGSDDIAAAPDVPIPQYDPHWGEWGVAPDRVYWGHSPQYRKFEDSEKERWRQWGYLHDADAMAEGEHQRDCATRDAERRKGEARRKLQAEQASAQAQVQVPKPRTQNLRPHALQGLVSDIPVMSIPPTFGQHWRGWGRAPNRIHPGCDPKFRKYENLALENARQWAYSQATLRDDGEHFLADLNEGTMEAYDRSVDAEWLRREEWEKRMAPTEVSSLLIVLLRLLILAVGLAVTVVAKTTDAVVGILVGKREHKALPQPPS
jgi:hypothetical protein